MDRISEHIYGGSSPLLVEHAASIVWGVREFVNAHIRCANTTGSEFSRCMRIDLNLNRGYTKANQANRRIG